MFSDKRATRKNYKFSFVTCIIYALIRYEPIMRTNCYHNDVCICIRRISLLSSSLRLSLAPSPVYARVYIPGRTGIRFVDRNISRACMRFAHDAIAREERSVPFEKEYDRSIERKKVEEISN